MRINVHVLDRRLLKWLSSYFLFFSDCPMGRTLNVSAWNCDECPVDSFKTLEGNGACTPCPTSATTRGKTGQTNDTCGMFKTGLFIKYRSFLQSLQI